jgi:hypothetical protein
MKRTLTFILTVLMLTKSSLHAQSDVQTTKQNIRHAALVLAEAMKNNDAKKVVLAGIQSGHYVDESILFRDLFNPGSSPAYRNNTYLGSTSPMAFATVFRSLLASGQYPQSAQHPSKSGLEAFLINSNAQIYFPYSDNFNLGSPINPAITFDPVSPEAESNGGWKFIEGRFVDVLVDDAYAQLNPTLIANFYEGDPDQPAIGTLAPGGEPDLDVQLAGGEDACEQPPHRMAVYIEDLRFESQWDGLFFGGPDFVFGRGELVYNGDGTQVSGAPSTVMVKLKRSHIRKWRNVNILWDTRWEFINDKFEENNQNFALYEDDESSSLSASFSGTVGGTVTIPKLGDVSYSVNPTVTYNTTSDDDVIINTQFDRCWFINSNTMDQGLGMRSGKAIRGVGGGKGVTFTMRINPY